MGQTGGAAQTAVSELNTGQVSHEATVYAEPIGQIDGFTVTNSLLNSWIVLFLIVILGLSLKNRVAMIPRGLQNLLESVFELFLNLFDSITGSRQKSLKFFPFVFCFFIYILLSNWLGLLPGIGSIGRIVSEHGRAVFIPFFRGSTADLNTTLALATIGVAASHIIGVTTIGVWKYFNKFINLSVLAEALKKVKSDPFVLMINPVKFFVGFMEIIGEIAKIVSLSLRLFGNIFAGEVLLASMSAIFAFGLPVPFMFLEVLVGAIQAMIFAVLVLSYLSMMTQVEEH